MGDACSPQNLAATISAHNQVNGRDIFTEAERFNQMNGEQRGTYERFIANAWGVAPKKANKTSAWDGLPKNKAKTIADHTMIAPPSDVLGKEFFGAIQKRESQWLNSKQPDYESYKAQIGKPARELLKALNTIVEESSPTTLNAKLKKYGLDTNTVSEAKNYLEWLGKGGPFQSKGNAKWLTDKASQLAKSQASYNLTWTLGNGVDAIRVGSHYAAKDFGALLEGTVRTLKSNPFKEHAEFKKQGIYDTQRIDVSGGKFDPFTLSIRAQKNWVAHIESARTGGDIKQGLKETLFEHSLLDVPRGQRFEGGDLVFGLARYPINESRWLYKETHAALRGNVESAKKLAIYGISRTLLTGTAAQIPAPVYMALPKDWKDKLSEIDKKYNFNLIKVVSRKAFKASGVDADLDVSDYVRPGGGSLGSRAAQLVTSGTSIARTGAKSVVNLAQGKLAPAAINATATAFAMANYGIFHASANKLLDITNKRLPVASGLAEKGTQLAEKLEKSAANNTTITKALKTAGEGLEKEFTSDQWKLSGLKAALGERNVKKAN